MDYPLDEKINRLKEEITDVSLIDSSGISRDLYLDLAEKIMRTAIDWQAEGGIIIDPYMKDEPNSATARFVGALGQLIKAGRCLDLIPECVRSYENCLDRLDEVEGAPEFWTKELMYAYEALDGKIEKERLSGWRDRWLAHSPQRLYKSIVKGVNNNFLIFAATGEFFKHHLGLGGDLEMVELCIEKLLNDFTGYGMYRDPADPIAYDVVVKQQLALMLSYGYSGNHLQTLQEICRRGSLTSLLYQSVTGQMPFGGRSNQFFFVDGHLACLFESAARFNMEKGDSLMAGVFKQAARRAALSTAGHILDMEPFRQLRQGTHPGFMHGLDTYGSIGVYGTLAASLFGTAYHLADESIEERALPSDVCGYVFDLWPAFHKVFAVCGGYYLEIDTRADHHYDATGLGALHYRGAPPETALSASLARDAHYVTNIFKAIGGSEPEDSMEYVDPDCRYHLNMSAFQSEITANLSLGPAWLDSRRQEWRLADFEEEIDDVRLETVREEADGLLFSVTYTGRFGEVGQVTETYALSDQGLRYEVSLDNPLLTPYILVPLLKTDGMEAAELEAGANAFVLQYRGAVYRVASRKTNSLRIMDGNPMPNRNALYLTGIVEDNVVEIALRRA